MCSVLLGAVVMSANALNVRPEGSAGDSHTTVIMFCGCDPKFVLPLTGNKANNELAC